MQVYPTNHSDAIRAPALLSVLANDTNSRTDGKAGARMAETEDDILASIHSYTVSRMARAIEKLLNVYDCEFG